MSEKGYLLLWSSTVYISVLKKKYNTYSSLNNYQAHFSNCCCFSDPILCNGKLCSMGPNTINQILHQLSCSFFCCCWQKRKEKHIKTAFTFLQTHVHIIYCIVQHLRTMDVHIFDREYTLGLSRILIWNLISGSGSVFFFKKT